MKNNPQLDRGYFFNKNIKSILLIVILILISIPIIQMMFMWGIWGIFGQLSDKIVTTTGVNHYLAKAIVLLFMIPLFLSFKWSFAINPFKWKIGYTVILCYTFIFYMSMFLLTKEHKFDYATGKATKYYAKTPEGIRYFDAPGFDPKYGIPLKPVDRDVIRKESVKERPLKKIEGPTQYFDHTTGEPLCWYYETSDGIIELYDHSGFHPKYGGELKPITQEIARRYERQLRNLPSISNIPRDGFIAKSVKFYKGEGRKDLSFNISSPESFKYLTWFQNPGPGYHQFRLFLNGRQDRSWGWHAIIAKGITRYGGVSPFLKKGENTLTVEYRTDYEVELKEVILE